jgi:hypothetical protein
MAITTYAQLKSAVASWAHRTNISDSVVSDFVTLAEAEFNRALRCVQQETRDTLSVTSRYTALPTDFLEMRRIEYDNSPVYPLNSMTPYQQTAYRQTEPSGVPLYYSIVGTDLEVVPTQSSVTLDILYYAKIPALSDSNTTNWLLTAYPDLYLSECLRQVAIYTKDDASVARYGQQVADAIQTIKRNDVAKRWSGPLVMRVG